jgi:LysR family cys regulon transcriptional activator
VDLRQLGALRLIAATGSFLVAASQMNLTKSALSQQISSLEEELGELLLVRARPKTYPTPAGLKVLASAERILSEVDSIKEVFNKTPEKLSGTLRLAGSSIAITHLYGDLIEEFVSAHRAVHVFFHATEHTDESVTRVLQRSVDVGFAVLPQANPNLVTIPMVRVEQVFVVSNNHPLAKRRSVTVDQLREWPFIRFEEKTGQRVMTDQIFGGQNNYPPILAELNDADYAKRLIRMSLGAVSLVPIFAVRREIESGMLHGLRLTTGKIMQDGCLVHRADMNHKALNVFVEVCLRLRGEKLRSLTLERNDEPLFGLQ